MYRNVLSALSVAHMTMLHTACEPATVPKATTSKLRAAFVVTVRGGVARKRSEMLSVKIEKGASYVLRDRCLSRYCILSPDRRLVVKRDSPERLSLPAIRRNTRRPRSLPKSCAV